MKERAGELRLSRKFRKSRSMPQPPWRLWVWPVSLHSFGALFLLCGTQPHNPTAAALNERVARGAQALAEIPQEPQPPWRLWVWPVSLHSFGALFLLCGTQPHNPTAALHERAARGAQALAEIPQEPQPPWRLWVWPVSLHSFGALFLLCGTQPHNPTAALHERAARGAQALAEIPQEPQPPWRLWVWPVSLHSFGALFLLCGTQPHNPTAALHERAARGAKALAEIPQEPQPPWRLWVWPVSLHSFGALFLFCGTQPHNPTAALHERAAPGELRLSRKFHKSRSPPGAALCVANSLPMTRFHSHDANS